MAELICPKCGSGMILRKSRDGNKPFYGCSRFPNCKGALPYEYADDDDEKPQEIKSDNYRSSFPKTLFAREKFQNYQVKFYECISLPYRAFLELIDITENDELLKAFSQWRLDFPSASKDYYHTEIEFQILSIIEKILTRGRITLCSHLLEQAFDKLILKESKVSLTDIIEIIAFRGYSKKEKLIYLDSDEEREFYERILPNYMGPSYEKFVIPQVSLYSLLPRTIDFNEDDISKRRVDFFISHPSLEKDIIIEIDGSQHKYSNSYDKERDQLLTEAGYLVIRIPAKAIINRDRDHLLKLEKLLSPIKDKRNETLPIEFSKYIQAYRIAHQIQIAILNALNIGLINFSSPDSWHIIIDIDEIGLFDSKEAAFIARNAVLDFCHLLEKTSFLYGLALRNIKPNVFLYSELQNKDINNGIFISFSNKHNILLPTFYIQDFYYKFHISNSSISASSANKPLNINEETLLYFLKYIFRKENFWEGQIEGISRILSIKDTLLLLPTGAGKSLIYQLSSFLLPGRTIIIDPIIALMEDQIDNLSRIGIGRCVAISSQIETPQDRSTILNLLAQGEYLFAFVAPERFQTKEFRESLRSLTVNTPISLIVIDEAHCVSEWGHDFRTAYLNIGRTTRSYCRSNNLVPPLVALTGTASRSVLKDIQRELQIDDFEAIITPKTFERKELKFHVIKASTKEKESVLRAFLSQKLPNLLGTSISTLFECRGENTKSGLIFCPHVSGDLGVKNVSDLINKELGISTSFYSGKEPYFWNRDDYQKHKKIVTRSFKRNKIPLLVCTKAFGMGIDKPNIRYTVHYSLPPSIESFYQEAGRAGRDRQTAHCCIIVSNDNPKRARYLLDPKTPVEDVSNYINSLDKDDNDDITRMLYFHTNSFRGISEELNDIKKVIELLENLDKTAHKSIPYEENNKWPDKNNKSERERLEKAIHRLLVIGVISDYTINYANHNIDVHISGATKEEIMDSYGNYVSSYLFSRKTAELEKVKPLINLPLKEFIIKVAELLLHFIYEVIEKSRRRALYEMLLTCSESSSDKDIRNRVLRYLESTEYSEALEEVINDDKFGISKCKDIFKSLCNPNEAAELRGQVSRYLESYPDHPTLLMLRALSEAFCKSANISVVKDNFIASVLSAKIEYEIDEHLLIDFVSWVITEIANHKISLAIELIDSLLEISDRNWARMLIEKLPINIATRPAWFLLGLLYKKCLILLNKKGGTYGKGKVFGSRGNSFQAGGNT